MNDVEETVTADLAHDYSRFSFSPPHYRVSTSATDLRIMELETENSQLQRLVLELVLRNEQLRKERN